MEALCRRGRVELDGATECIRFENRDRERKKLYLVTREQGAAGIEEELRYGN